jgi:hypothetical protein
MKPRDCVPDSVKQSFDRLVGDERSTQPLLQRRERRG